MYNGMGHLYVASGEGNGWAPLTEAGLRDPHGNDSGVSPPLPPSHSISLSLLEITSRHRRDEHLPGCKKSLTVNKHTTARAWVTFLFIAAWRTRGKTRFFFWSGYYCVLFTQYSRFTTTIIILVIIINSICWYYMFVRCTLVTIFFLLLQLAHCHSAMPCTGSQQASVG